MIDSKFLKTILGEKGLEALKKSVDKAPFLEDVIVPRAILSWVTAISKVGYEGTLPGDDNTYFSLVKTEDGFSGALTVQNKLYTFTNANVFHVAASLGVALGIESKPLPEVVKGRDLSPIGKTIDLLIKTECIKHLKNFIKSEKSISQNETKINVSSSEMNKKCKECDQPFFKNEKFSGCLCLSSLGSFVKTSKIPEGVCLTFKKGIHEDEIEVIASALK